MNSIWSFRTIVWQLAQLGSLTVVSQASLAIASLLITRSMSPSHWGWVAFGLTVQGYLVMVSSGSMRSLIIDRIGKNPQKISETVTAFCMLACGLSATLSLMWYCSGVLYGLDRYILGPLCVLAIGTVANAMYPTSLFEAKWSPVIPNRIASVIDVGFLLLVLGLVFADTIQILSVAILFAIKWGLTCGLQWVYFLRPQRIRWVANREEIVAIVRGIPHQAFFSLASTIPISSGILATQFGISSSDAGCLSLATMVQQAYILLSVQFHRIVQPRLVLDHRSTNSGNHTDIVFRWLSAYLLVLGMIAWGASSAVVWFILPIDYRPVLSLLPWTILAGALTSASYMASFQITVLGNQKYLSPVAVFVAVLHICLCTVLLRWKSVEMIAMMGFFSAMLSQLLLTIILRLQRREVKVN